MLIFDFFGGERVVKNLDIYFVMRLQIIFNEDELNKDIKYYYGPLNLKIYFNKLAEKLFNSNELYFEYYNGGQYAEKFERSSFRVSLRGKPWSNEAAPKVFFQYFNGFSENLGHYNKREETYRIGLSLGGS